MKSIDEPKERVNDVLDIIINDGVSESLKALINENRLSLIRSEDEYIAKIKNNLLYEIELGVPANISLTKNNLLNYYNYRLLKKENGRKFYDKLMLSVPYNICPYCTIKSVNTIDHFLPKSKFPVLSVTPSNLVPSCRDCNTQKKYDYPKDKDSQTFHPYFDKIDDEPWIVAELIDTEPLILQFKIEKLLNWSNNKYRRVITHFDAYNIKQLFSNEANRELRARQFYFKKLQSRDINEFKQHLQETYESCRDSLGMIDWRTVMYKCLMNNDWFINGCKGNSYFN